MLSRAHNSLRLKILPLTLFDSRFCQQFLANPMIPISQGEGDPMPYFPNVPRRQHLKVNGTQSPRLRPIKPPKLPPKRKLPLPPPQQRERPHCEKPRHERPQC